MLLFKRFETEWEKSYFLWIQEELHNLILIAIKTSILTKPGIFIM